MQTKIIHKVLSHNVVTKAYIHKYTLTHTHTLTPTFKLSIFDMSIHTDKRFITTNKRLVCICIHTKYITGSPIAANMSLAGPVKLPKTKSKDNKIPIILYY